jgi:apolipoprotein N-acyltransferase
MLFRHRAAETGRWIAVAATSGVTQIIDPHGNVVDRLPAMTEDVLVGQVARSNHTTFYVRIGWVLGPACAIASAVVLLWSLVSFWRCQKSA